MTNVFFDIDGVLVTFDIQKYIGAIELFGNEPIRDLEYMIKCTEFMMQQASYRFNITNNKTDKDEFQFIHDYVLPFAKNNLEYLKENRDCFLEFDNLENKEDKKDYIKKYQESGKFHKIENLDSIVSYLKYSLKEAHNLIKNECSEAKKEGRQPRLPFAIIDETNDIICNNFSNLDLETIMYEQPILRAKSALRRLENMDFSFEKDDFLETAKQYIKTKIVDYDEIYTTKNLVEGSYVDPDTKEKKSYNAFDTIREIASKSEIKSTPALSHHTGPRETKSKVKLFSSVLDLHPKSLTKFHLEPAQMGVRRVRSNKATIGQQIMYDKIGVSSIEGQILIDDSMENLVNWANAGGLAVWYKPLTPEEVAGSNNLKAKDARIVRMFSLTPQEFSRVYNIFIERQNILPQGKILIR